MRVTRRDFFAEAGRSATGLCAGVFLLPSWLEADTGPDPHFFLQIFVPGGMDSSYLFDGRPLSMTQAGKIQNYLGEEPSLWQGQNGQRTLATRLARKLAPYRDRFSVINGVIMTTAFDGHSQNVNYMFSGNPFGGDSFIPDLNRGESPFSLDTIMQGQVRGSFRNLEKTVPLSAESAARLVQKNKSVPALNPNIPAMAFIRSRMAANGLGAGGYSTGSGLLARAYDESQRLSTQLAGINMSFVSTENDAEGRFLETMLKFFRNRVSRSALIAFDTEDAVDTHDPGRAARQPGTYDQITARLRQIFEFLEKAEFLPGRNLWEFTTVVVATEFGRTMKQGAKPIDQTGTDHNPVANSLLLAGKGIRGNLVIGETDFRSATETVSPAHARLDPQGVKAMARPFDFDRFVPRADLPPEFVDQDYIGIPSIVNSIYSVFGVDRSRYWRVNRSGPVAKVLTPLLRA